MGQLAINTIIPLITALGGVILTFWFREKQETIGALRAIKTELKHNDDLGESTLHDLFSDRSDSYDELIQRDTVPLQTSAFKHFVNSGGAVKISDDLEDSIWYHYLVIRKLNRDIERRLDAFDKQEIERIDQKILNSLLYLSGEQRLAVMKENIRGNQEAEEDIKESLERQARLERRGWGDITVHTFDGIQDLLESEIYERHPVPKWLLRRLDR